MNLLVPVQSQEYETYLHVSGRHRRATWGASKYTSYGDKLARYNNIGRGYSLTLDGPFAKKVLRGCSDVSVVRVAVLGWLQRWSRRGFRVGQFWYLVEAEWWRAWAAYTRHAEPCASHAPRAPHPPHAPHAPRSDDALVCDESFTTDSTGTPRSFPWLPSLLSRLLFLVFV